MPTFENWGSWQVRLCALARLRAPMLVLERHSLGEICKYTNHADEIQGLQREHQSLTEQAGRVRQRA